MRWPRPSWPLSEGSVRIDRPLQGPGVCVHRCASDCEFVRLYAHESVSLRDPQRQNNEVEAQTIDFRIMVGQRADALCVRVSWEDLRRGGCILCNDLALSGTEEVWLSCSVPGACAVHGVVSLGAL
jgi:hypothetical protein